MSFLDCFLSILGFPAHGNARFALEAFAEHLANPRIVIDERIYRSGSLAVSCLAYCGLLVCFDLNFNFGPLFQACFPAFVVRQSVLNANLPIQIISFLNAEFPLFRAVSDKQA